MKSSSRDKGFWVLILILLAGLTVGGFIGSLCKEVPYLGWLDYGQTFGLEEPLKLDLGLIWLSVQLVVKFTISGIIGMVLSVIVYRKM
ncbi:MAG TPA: DUF4321 domain-containing protein [Epulopiscium sp.]|nr:DUF4321 domain-containing protein [Candidatus Epulonipiscium sp.]